MKVKSLFLQLTCQKLLSGGFFNNAVPAPLAKRESEGQDPYFLRKRKKKKKQN